ncbi:HAMP domain-containing protein [Bacillus sp. Bva_UNVM-123]|uniref:sensor histidine kinase n=1 Tax=Bacillus sp. Bva_UNVM-123 TaxID=2829798 RepID=UPI00391F22EE
MIRGIVLKLFLLTTALCVLILATIFIGQTIFFKQFYVNKKVEDLKTSIHAFEKSYLENVDDLHKIQQLERSFSEKNNAWITILDENGNLKYENDFFIEIELNEYYQRLYDFKTVKAPLYMIDNFEEGNLQQSSESLINQGEAYIFGILRGSQIIPVDMIIEGELEDTNSGAWKEPVNYKNKLLINLTGDPVSILKENRVSMKESKFVGIGGKIRNIEFPERNTLSSVIYSNSLFLDQIRDFQNKILLNDTYSFDPSMQITEYEQNDIKYNILIKPIKQLDGNISYIYSMTSLQPVDEAIQMIEEYYVYIIAFVFILILLASFYYSRKIAKPLLRINRTTKKMANLDFSETISVHSKDEIGDLSRNINSLSYKLSTYIEQLQHDIEKEKKLENTRKEFISGVSHELKTPLSIMKSCITILRGQVATHKKEYYFNAMEKEVDKMDLMIVDMLELAKYESGTYKMQMNSFYIDELMEEMCEKLSHEIKAKQLQVEASLLSIEVVANKNRIEQVLTNFMTNAIRYTPNGERICIVTEKKETTVKISIENKGAHIEDDLIEKVWDRFYRVDTSRKRSIGGTGLGLAISKNILQLHNVDYGVCNTEDGVQFYFYLQINE